jgi:tetratricopeptide (TPR) repeat protein
MNHLLYKSFPVVLILSSALFSQTELEQGKTWYAKRTNHGAIDSAIFYLDKALKDTELEKEAALTLMKCYYFKGTFSGLTKDQKKKIFNKGKVLGEKMHKKYPKSAPVTYWLAVQWGRWAEVYGKLAAARQGVADKLKVLSEEVIRLDPKYDDGAGYRLLGRIHHQSPRIPFILSWPSNQEAIKNLRKARDISPDNVTTNLFLAEVLLDEDHKEEAIKILEALVRTKARAGNRKEDNSDLRKARKLLKKYKK